MLAPTVDHQPNSGGIVPKAVVRIEPGEDYWRLIVLQCPICGQKRGRRPGAHLHGGGPLSERPSLGSRLSHCFTRTPQLYELVAEEDGE